MRIFLSSTFLDLIHHRQAVINALERLGQQVGRMEIFGSRPTEPLKASLTEIDECDLFVGIYAHRYGHIPLGSRYSITEQEFRHAQKQAKPLFCYLADDTYDRRQNLGSWGPRLPMPSTLIEALVEVETSSTKLSELKEHIRKNLVVDFFREPLDLAVKVVTSIGYHLIHHPDFLVIQAGDATERRHREELITLLETRKDTVLSTLRSSDSQVRFLELHAKNIAAIRKGELLLSHLLTADIHSLIYDVEMPRINAERGAGVYCPLSHSYFAPLYPYDAQSTRVHWHCRWSEASGWHRRPKSIEVTEGFLAQPGLWRDRLLNDWLTTELSPLQSALAKQRELERDANASGEYEGHQMRGGMCIQCGGSMAAIRHFGFKCRS